MPYQPDRPEGRRANVYASGKGVPEGAPVRPRKRRQSRVLAVVVLVVVAIVIALTGVAAKDGGLDGSEGNLGTFKLLPITTTTS
jgi:hypothetical protein